MIDNLRQVDALITKMRMALPIMAGAMPELAAVMREQLPGHALPRQWRITEVHYSGDPGGIMCRLVDGAVGGFVVSITQLRFDRKTPCAREITAYQKHRVKGLKKLGAASLPLREHRPRES